MDVHATIDFGLVSSLADIMESLGKISCVSNYS